MAAPAQPTHLVVNDVLVGSLAIRFRTPAGLFDTPPLVGANRRVGRSRGRRRYARWPDEQTVTFPLQLHGRWDPESDAVNTDPDQGLVDLVQYLHSNLGIGAAEVGFEFHSYDGSSRTTDEAQVLGLRATVMASPSIANTTLDVILPPGFLAEIGS